MEIRINVVVVLCLVLFCSVEGVYENNPFLNGNYNTPGLEVPSKVDEMPVNVVNLPAVKPQVETQDSVENLRKYCLSPRGNFRSKYCNTFVDCWEDRAVEFTCPPPLYFNSQGYCDYPQNVNCDGKAIKPGSPLQPSNNGSYIPPPSVVPVVDPIVPQYPTYSPSGWPSDGSYKPPVASNPPQNQIDNGSWKPGQGNWDDGSYKPSQGGWDDGSYKPAQGSWDDGSYKPQPPTSLPVAPPANLPVAPPANAPVAPPTSSPVVPPGAIQQPVSPVQVSTKPPDVTLPALGVSTTSPILLPQLPASKYCKNPRGQFPGSACNKYIDCWDGIALERECPEGLNFNAYKGYCDYPWIYNCNHDGQVPVAPTPAPVESSSVQPPISSTPSSLPLLPANKFCKDHRGQFPGSACNKYVNCWDGIAVEQECPEGYNFNPQKGYCDFPWNYNCGDNSGIPAGVPTTSAPVTAMPPASVTTEGWAHLLKYCLKPRGQFPGTSCEKYVNCWDGYVVEQECPKGLIFNPIKFYCDYGPHPNCPRTFRNQNTSTGAIDPLLTCKTGTIFSLNEECSHVAICRNDLIEIVQCPQGLKYDVHKDSCLEPHLAKC